MEKHRASWKAELWLRRKIHSPDKFQDPKKMPGTGNSQGSRSLRRASSDVVRPLNRQVKILDNDASVTPKLEKTKGATREQSSQRNNHKDKAHRKGQHGWLKILMNLLTRTESEEPREKEEKKSKEKYISPQDPKYVEASVDPPEPTFRKKDREREDKKSKEKCIFPQSPESLEVQTEPPQVTSKKKHKEKGDKKLKEKCIFPQGPESLQTEPSEVTSKKKHKEKGDKKSKEKCTFPQSPESLEVQTEPPQVTSKKKHKEKGDKKLKEKCILPQGPESLQTEPSEVTSKKKHKEKGDKKSKEKCIFPQSPESLPNEPSEVASKKKDKTKKDKKSKEKCTFPQCQEPLEPLAEPLEPISRKKDKKSSLKKAFSFKKHSNEEAKRSSGLDSRSPEARRPTKPTFLPLCFSYRPASLTTLDSDEVEVHETVFTEVRTLDSTGLSTQDGQPPPRDQGPSNKDEIIQNLAVLLREKGDKCNEKIKDLNFNADWNNLFFTSIQTLADVLRNQEEKQEPSGNQIEIHYHFLNKYAGNTNHAVHRIMGWRDPSVTHTFGHISYNNQQQEASTPFLSPD
ncbi:protein BNIP5 isoform X2 [Sminthopsis crassicaudata]|uniref:protein BNIP5 isoform X2 n=1 Tax=Sminthopsis crassicaudata TaxID=9301 RepID=UPI003D68EC8D